MTEFETFANKAATELATRPGVTNVKPDIGKAWANIFYEKDGKELVKLITPYQMWASS
jgi:hypothetical protein